MVKKGHCHVGAKTSELTFNYHLTFAWHDRSQAKHWLYLFSNFYRSITSTISQSEGKLDKFPLITKIYKPKLSPWLFRHQWDMIVIWDMVVNWLEYLPCKMESTDSIIP